MRTTALALALLGLLQSCGGEGMDSSLPSRHSAQPADPGQIELWKLELMMEDRASNNRVQQSGPSSWSTSFAPDGSAIRPGVGEIRGRDALHEAFMEDIYSNLLADLTWTPERAEVSGSGDLGYTVGQYLAVFTGPAGNRTPERGKYVRIWARQAGGDWRVTLEIRNPVGDPG